jgi:hypothetical protein
MDCRTALLTILDSVDYTAGNCRVNEMVGAVLPREMIVMARMATAIETCEWKELANEFETTWDTLCGETFILIEGTPVENSMNFCPYCGKKVKQVLAEIENDEAA